MPFEIERASEMIRRERENILLARCLPGGLKCRASLRHRNENETGDRHLDRRVSVGSVAKGVIEAAGSSVDDIQGEQLQYY